MENIARVEGYFVSFWFQHFHKFKSVCHPHLRPPTLFQLRTLTNRSRESEFAWNFSWILMKHAREPSLMYHQDISPPRWRYIWGELTASLLQITKRERNLRQLHSNGGISEHATSATTRKGIRWECSRCKFHRGLHRIVISSPSSSPSDVINHETILESIPALGLPILHTDRG